MTKRIRLPSLMLVTLLCACEDTAPNSPNLPVAEPSSPSPVADLGGTETGDAITLGKALNPDNTIVSPSRRFATTDTIYVSVGTGSQRETSTAGTLKAKWSFGTGTGAVFKVDSLPLTPTGPTISAFRLNDPQGLAVGAYQVELTINDRQIAVRTFTVE